MTGRWRLARTLLDYTATASSELSDQPATNLKRYTEPFAVWQQGAVPGDQWVKADLGANPPALDGLLVVNCNALTPLIETSPDDITWTLFGGGDGVFPVGVDQRVNRRRLYVDTGGLVRRYWRITMGFMDLDEGFGYDDWGGGGWPGNNLMGGALYMGTLALLSPIVSLVNSPWRPTGWQRVDGGIVGELTSGNFEVEEAGRPYLETQLVLRSEKSAGEGDAQWAQLGLEGPVVLIEDFGDQSHAVLARRVGPDGWSEDNWFVNRNGLVLREAV